MTMGQKSVDEGKKEQNKRTARKKVIVAKSGIEILGLWASDFRFRQGGVLVQEHPSASSCRPYQCS
jgi:hypothetical protein